MLEIKKNSAPEIFPQEEGALCQNFGKNTIVYNSIKKTQKKNRKQVSKHAATSGLVRTTTVEYKTGENSVSALNRSSKLMALKDHVQSYRPGYSNQKEPSVLLEFGAQKDFELAVETLEADARQALLPLTNGYRPKTTFPAETPLSTNEKAQNRFWFFWRPDLYPSPLRPRCQLVEKTSDCKFVYQVNDLVQPEFAASLPDEVVAALPIVRVSDSCDLPDSQVASGLPLAGFSRALLFGLSALTFVLSDLPPTPAKAALPALSNLASDDVRKPHYEAPIMMKQHCGITSHRKRLQPARRRQAVRAALNNVHTVLHGTFNVRSRSVSFASAQADFIQLWSHALKRSLDNP